MYKIVGVCGLLQSIVYSTPTGVHVNISIVKVCQYSIELFYVMSQNIVRYSLVLETIDDPLVD